MVGSQTTLTQIFLATSPNSGDRKRVRLLPEPAANSARTSEWNGSTCHAPTSAGLRAAGAATSAPNRTLAESAASAMMDLCYTGQRGDLGHSMGGGEIVRYFTRHGSARVRRAPIDRARSLEHPCMRFGELLRVPTAQWIDLVGRSRARHVAGAAAAFMAGDRCRGRWIIDRRRGGR